MIAIIRRLINKFCSTLVRIINENVAMIHLASLLLSLSFSFLLIFLLSCLLSFFFILKNVEKSNLFHFLHRMTHIEIRKIPSSRTRSGLMYGEGRMLTTAFGEVSLNESPAPSDVSDSERSLTRRSSRSRLSMSAGVDQSADAIVSVCVYVK
jgi:hypothetical protein